MTPQRHTQGKGGPFFCRIFDTCLTTKRVLNQSARLQAWGVVALLGLAGPVHAMDLLANDTVLKGLIEQALTQNPGLQSQTLRVEAQQARLEGLRARYWPALGLNARASVAEGGRTIDFPAGDLLNPVYATLNQQAVAQGQPARFPTLQNQSIPLLRPTEQDTRLQLSGPLYVPQLDAQVMAQQQSVKAEGAAQRKFREELTRDVQVAYWQVAQAQAQLNIFEDSLQTLQENERVTQALYKAGSVTLDAPKRASAETLDMKVNVQRAQAQLALAKEYLNSLRNAPAQAPLEVPAARPSTAQLTALQAKLTQQLAAKPEEHSRASTRPAALEQLDRNVEALQANKLASQASYKPNVVYQVDAGYQGKDYSTGPKTGFAQASVVLSWSLLDGGTRSAAVRQADLELRALEAKRQEAVRQLELAKSQARQNLEVSVQSLQVRQAQQAAAAESLRISTRKRDAGELTQVEFLSAQSAATRSELALVNAAYQAQIDLAVWQFNNRHVSSPQKRKISNGVQP